MHTLIFSILSKFFFTQRKHLVNVKMYLFNLYFNICDRKYKIIQSTLHNTGDAVSPKLQTIHTLLSLQREGHSVALPTLLCPSFSTKHNATLLHNAFQFSPFLTRLYKRHLQINEPCFRKKINFIETTEKHRTKRLVL